MAEFQADKPSDLGSWMRMAESLRNAPEWETSELPVEMVQTHISVVLLSLKRALKLKKPVDFGFLDYTTPEKRRLACEAEVALNRRLCADAYLGVQPIYDDRGMPRLSGQGPIVDYGVMMKRLPATRMLDGMIARNEVTESIIDRVAERLSTFHRGAKRGPGIDALGAPEAIRANWEENFLQCGPYIGRTVSADSFEMIRNWIDRWMKDNDDLFRSRVREGRICDGHGDVRAESICVTDRLCIFDCIEFNERFRFGDVASEVAFLAMDLDSRGRQDLSYYFAERYQSRVEDPRLSILLPFYRCYRAYVRGKVMSFRLDAAEFTAQEREMAAMRAKRFFDLARRYADKPKHKMVILIGGLSGTGKTSLARAIAGELGFSVVSSDAVRKTIFEMSEEYGYGAGPYSADANRLTYEKATEIGRGLLEKEGGVVLDATFRREADRERARALASEAGAVFRTIECKLSHELVRERLDRRASLAEGLSDARWETYTRQQLEYEPFAEVKGEHLELDTGRDLGVISHIATDWLRYMDG